MILTCPSCHARFSVADHLIPTGGRTVRCSKCAHAWHVEKTSFSADAPPESPPVVVEASAPVVATPAVEMQQPKPTPAPEPMPNLDAFELPKPQRRFSNPGRRASDRKGLRNPLIFKIAAPVLMVSWIILAFITYSPTWKKLPGLSSIYEMMGSLPTEGLAFADLSMTREQEGSKTKFILAGSIRNTSSEVRLVPTVRVLLKDKQNKTIWGREYPVNQAVKAGEVYPFRITNVETAFAKSVARIVVDMGNPMELLVR